MNPRAASKPDRLVLLSKDPTVGFGLSLEDPRVSGASLRIVSLPGAFDRTFELSAGAWTATRRGYKYRDAGTRVVIRTGSRLKVLVRDGDLPLDGGDPTPVVVTLRIGDRRLCLEFPDGLLKSKGRRLIAKNASPPAVCNEPAAP